MIRLGYNMDVDDKLLEVIETCGYSHDAVFHVCQAINHATTCIHGERKPDGHVTAKEICKAVCELAEANYGYQAYDELTQLRLLRGEDVGSIVYALIDGGLATQRDSDRIDDFNGIDMKSLLMYQPESVWSTMRRWMDRLLGVD